MKIIFTACLCLFLVSCGAKTKQELVASSAISEHYVVNKNYQIVYKGIADKFVECSGGVAQYIQRNLYSDIGEGEFYIAGGDLSGYIFLVEVKKIEDNITNIAVYSKMSAGKFPEYVDMVKYGADGKIGCPK